jgi:hypothetical protein
MAARKMILSIVFLIVALIVTPSLHRRGDGLVFSYPLDWRLGKMVKAQAIAAFPILPLARLQLTLEPEDYRRGYMMKAAGKAKFFGPKKNNCHQLEYTCRYEPLWGSGSGLFQLWPAQIKVSDCKAVQIEIPI